MNLAELSAEVEDVAKAIDLEGQFRSRLPKPLATGRWAKMLVRNSETHHLFVELYFDAVVTAEVGDEKAFAWTSEGGLVQCLTTNVCLFYHDFAQLSPDDRRLGLQLVFDAAMRFLRPTHVGACDERTVYDLHGFLAEHRLADAPVVANAP